MTVALIQSSRTAVAPTMMMTTLIPCQPAPLPLSLKVDLTLRGMPWSRSMVTLVQEHKMMMAVVI